MGLIHQWEVIVLYLLVLWVSETAFPEGTVLLLAAETPSIPSESMKQPSILLDTFIISINLPPPPSRRGSCEIRLG